MQPGTNDFILVLCKTVYLFMCVFVHCVGVYMGVNVCRLENNLLELVLSFHHVGLKHLYPPRYFIGLRIIPPRSIRCITELIN